MSGRPDERTVRDSIDRVAGQWREHCERAGKTITHEQARDRVREAYIQHHEKPNQR